jgi:hypothetical protein
MKKRVCREGSNERVEREDEMKDEEEKYSCVKVWKVL